jgi:betaine-aldehyde dehydrogenase
MRAHDDIYIDGSFVRAEGGGHIDVIHSATEEVIGRVPAGSAADVDRAVRAARRAFDGWSRSAPAERAALLDRIAEGLKSRSAEIADTVAAEVGMPLKLATAIQAGLPPLLTASFAKLVREYRWEEQINNSLVVREPVGVVGCITPWNYPLMQMVLKVAPALAAGCTVVLKPSELAPLTSYILAEIIDAAEAPPGVFNLVSGPGVPVGEALAEHPDIDMVSFTGSTRAGKRVAELASRSIKRVALELGGKSASIVLDDADLERAVTSSISNCYLNSGQTCSAWTRLLVPERRLDEVCDIAKRAAESFTVGDPSASGTKLGPLVSRLQRDRVRAYIQRGIEEGARLVTGGVDAPEDLERGFYVRPTVFRDVKSEMTIAQEEIFGPVLCIIGYRDEDDAVRIANDTAYGLGGGVWSADEERAVGVARRVRTGQVDINGGRFNPMAPFGGFKQSGYGREYGREGLEEYLETKAMQR